MTDQVWPWSVTTRWCGLDPAVRLVEPVECRSVWLTGQSSYRHSQLSPGQHLLLDATAEVGFTPLRAGFPYHPDLLTVPYRPEPLIVASVRNTAQYLAARFSQRFPHEIARRLQPLLDRTGRRLLALCGSSGLEWWTAAWHLLRLPPGVEILLLALGPVGRPSPADPRARLVIVRGRRDWISALGCRRPAQVKVDGGHLDYVHLPEVEQTVRHVAKDFLG